MTNLQYAEFLSDEELQKVAPLLKRLKKLDDRSESQEDFRDIFPDIRLATDAKAAGRWSTNKSGEYYAVGVGGILLVKNCDNGAAVPGIFIALIKSLASARPLL